MGEVGELVFVVFGGVQEPTMMAQPSVSVCLALYVTLAAAKESAVSLSSASKCRWVCWCFSWVSSVAWRVAVASASRVAADSAWSRPALRSDMEILLSCCRMS